MQKIKNLEKGRLYCLKALSCDYVELTTHKSAGAQTVRIDINNAEIMPDQTQVGVIEKGEKEKQFHLYYHWTVFRATGNEANLTISDWADDKTMGGPEGQELICNFIQVQPYFAREQNLPK